MSRLPRTDMNHGLAVAWFALSCLYADITHHRKRSA